ncbi:MAG: biotin--[acetyl-CoA-carboxylase] ligase [Treponema sp.]|jgi:BirA family biotin operon repressor/biotin-[acetyl-CoA-carboxylase] ligase|nr:biotin--[acetyl-CoA-carboxylase] ligase [Treponema sp.]
MQFGGKDKTYTLVEVDSTNEYAKTLAKAGAPSGTVVRAQRQTRGKGTRNRTWVSPEGNVYWSGIIQAKDLGEARFSDLVYVNALAVYHAIARYTEGGSQVAIKWPNDMLLQEKKIAGSLLECGAFDERGKPGWIVIGTGINVAVSPSADPSMVYPPASLREMGYTVSPESLIAALQTYLSQYLADWLDRGFNALRTAYLARAFRLHKELSLGLSPDKAEYVTGRYEGIDENGHIILTCSDTSIKKFHSGDVFLRS